MGETILYFLISIVSLPIPSFSPWICQTATLVITSSPAHLKTRIARPPQMNNSYYLTAWAQDSVVEMDPGWLTVSNYSLWDFPRALGSKPVLILRGVHGFWLLACMSFTGARGTFLMKKRWHFIRSSSCYWVAHLLRDMCPHSLHYFGHCRWSAVHCSGHFRYDDVRPLFTFLMKQKTSFPPSLYDRTDLLCLNSLVLNVIQVLNHCLTHLLKVTVEFRHKTTSMSLISDAKPRVSMYFDVGLSLCLLISLAVGGAKKSSEYHYWSNHQDAWKVGYAFGWVVM